MMYRSITIFRLAFAVAVTALLTATLSSTQAQTDPTLLTRPWDNNPHWAETIDEPIFIDGGHTKSDDRGIKLMHYNSEGRVKFDREQAQPDVMIGYRVLTIDISTDHPSLPSGLTDLSVSAAVRLGEIIEGWKLGVLAGAGTANDNHFDEGDAIYGIGALHVSHAIDLTQVIHVGLSYNGNRTFLPDVPLPYITWVNRVNETLEYMIGVPTSSVWWKPSEAVTVEVIYQVPTNITGTVSYNFTPQVSVFTAYNQNVDAFHRQGGGPDRRIFFQISRVSTGVRYIYGAWVDVKLGVGYAFNQEFGTGFDLRGTNTIAEPSDEPFVFFTVQGTF